MAGQSLPFRRRRPASACKAPRTRNRTLRSELLESREMLSGHGFPFLLIGIPSVGTASTVHTTANAAPTVAQAICVNNNAAITGISATLSVLGSDSAGASSLTYTWSVVAAPGGGTVAFSLNGSNAADNTTATFDEAGTYTLSVKILDRSGLSVSTSKSLVVTPTLASISMHTASNQTLNSVTPLVVSGVSQAIVPQGVDQFGNYMATLPTFAWLTTSSPLHSPAPQFTTSGGITTVTFAMAGSYAITARPANATNVSFTTTMCVNQTLTTITVSPNAPSIVQGATQQFTAQAFDQFSQPLANQPTFTWSDSAGTITTAGLFTAPGSGSSCSVFAKNGSVQGTTTISLHAPVNSTPTVAQQICVNGNAAVTGKTAALSVLGNDANGGADLTYTWSVVAAPSGGTAAFGVNGSNAAKNDTATFNEAGTYTLSVNIVGSGGLSVSTSKSVVVTSTVAGIILCTTSGQSVSYSAPLGVTGTSQTIVAEGVDQFGAVMATQPAFTWTTTPLSASTPTPNFTTSANTATVTFTKMGTYALTASVANNPGISTLGELIVAQTLTSVRVTPNTASICQSASQQFAASAFDQFQNAMTTQPVFAWSASGGSITSAGLFTAPSSTGSYTITATTGSVRSTATVQVASGAFQNAFLSSLVTSLDADGSISRLDMIQILRSVAANGAVTASELSDLQKIVSEGATLNMPGYVQVLAGDVVNGNAANATYQGQTLGKLAVNSSPTQLNDLIGKWFFGTDLPTLCNTSLTYAPVAGSLFPHTPSHNDEVQGLLGDCYFISAMGTLADSNPAAVENMFINNGDGTYTVRFYSGPYGVINNGSGAISAGFTNDAGVADYVTVNNMLPVGGNPAILAYADYGASATNAANALWIPLAEKAYAQWNQTGNEGRSGTNAFADIQGGWMATVDAQVCGYNAADYIMTTTSEQTAINAIAAHEAVTIGTASWWVPQNNEYATQDGLYGNHAYAITGYTASTNTFTLFNPWNCDQPGQLTWGQLQNDCTQMCIDDPSHSVAIPGVTATKVGTVAATVPNRASAASVALFFESAGVGGRASAGNAGSQFSAAANELHDVFATLGISRKLHGSQTRIANATHGVLSASEVDALFAAGVGDLAVCN